MLCIRIISFKNTLHFRIQGKISANSFKIRTTNKAVNYPK